MNHITTSKMVKYWLPLAILILAVPVVILSFSQDRESMRETSPMRPIKKLLTPRLSQQPKDTLISSKHIPLHFWRTQTDRPVYFVPTENAPILDIRLIFDAGSARDGDTPGVAMMLSQLLTEGTLTRDGDALVEAIETTGSQYSFSVQPDSFEVSVRTLADENIYTVINLMNEILREPKIPERDFERIKRRVLQQIEQSQQYPQTIAYENFFEAMYGDHPYAHDPEGTKESLAAMTRQDLIDFHKKYITTKNVTIAIVGAVHRDDAQKIADTFLKGLPKGQPVAKIKPVQESKKKEEFIFFDSTQSHILMGMPLRKVDDSDKYALKLANHALGGGGFQSRLMKEIRVARGLAYSAHSNLTAYKEKGPFIIDVVTKNESRDEALQLVRKTVSTFVKEGMTQEELDIAKVYYTNNFPQSFNTNQKILNIIAGLAFYKTSIHDFENYEQIIEELDLETVNRVISKRIQPDKMSLVVVGHAGES